MLKTHNLSIEVNRVLSIGIRVMFLCTHFLSTYTWQTGRPVWVSFGSGENLLALLQVSCWV